MLENQTAFAARLNVSRQCINGYIREGKLSGASLVRQGTKVMIDVERATKQLKRRLDPDQRIANGKAKLAQPSPEADAPALWSIVAAVPAMAAWHVAEHGSGLQHAFDTHADMALDIAAEVRLRGFSASPIPFDLVDWTALAEAYDLDPTDPDVLAADWNCRRLSPSAPK